MNTYRKILFVLIICLSVISSAQSHESKSDTLLNQVDENGLKQGAWITHYDNGSKKYEGTFKNDKPIGTFTRYYPNQKIQSVMEFEEDGKSSFAKVNYENGNLAAEGKYVNRLKDSEWKYYSFYNLSLTYSENYKLGVKEGVSTVYFSNGKVSETIFFQNNEKNGIWAQYFENGRLHLKGKFIKNKLNGVYVQYHPNGITHIKGMYVEDRRDGQWLLYDEEGKQVAHFDFVMGIASNQEELNKIQEEYLQKLEKNIGKIREPSISDIKF